MSEFGIWRWGFVCGIITFGLLLSIFGPSERFYNYNSPELRQCLSQSGTTWQGGECVIILNK